MRLIAVQGSGLPNAGLADTLGYAFIWPRQYDQAIRAFQKILELEPDDIGAHVGLGWVYGEKKMYHEAIAEMEKSINLSNRRDEYTLAVLGKILGNSGRKQGARKLLQELKERSKHRYISPYFFALVRPEGRQAETQRRLESLDEEVPV